MIRLALLFLTLALPALAQSLPERLTGVWRGDGIETDGLRWALIVFLRPDGAVVDYPDFPCSAYWSYDRDDASGLFATEHLVAGRTLCADNSAVRLRSDGAAGLLVEWIDPDGSVSAVAQLVRD